MPTQRERLRELLTEIFGPCADDLSALVKRLNQVRRCVAEYSPFQSEPVDLVEWVPAGDVHANDYNPNSVAPPEMELLRLSIMADGYTQPVVTNREEDRRVVVDGFHRNRVGKECADVKKRVQGFLPVVQIRSERTDTADRMASTIRHNRARGKHSVEGMSEIVVELKRRNWSNERIARELGMDQDEVLRLCQITGLAELFSDQEFSRSWDVEGEIALDDFVELTDDVTTYGEEAAAFRTVNTSDEKRVFHTWDKWECHKAGFYNGSMNGMPKEQCEETYRAFLSDLPRFARALNCVTLEWVHSCEHYLTNASMNRIAWLGQAAVCYATGIPSTFRGGFNLLTREQQEAADKTALKYLNRWLVANGHPETTLDAARTERQSDIY